MRLITPYPAHAKVDRILQNLGEDIYHDDVHCLADGADDTAVAEGDQEASGPSSDESDGDHDPAEHVRTAAVVLKALSLNAHPWSLLL